MRIYVDFDDCLCETGRAFSKLALEMFNKQVPYDQIRYFELDKSFDLDAEQYEQFMLRGHEPEILLSFEATPGAAETINEWISYGYEVSIITGRPSSVYEPSRIWLDEHGLKNAKLYCLNKYGRDHFIKNSNSTLELEDYYRMKFDYAVEDSPKAFRFFEHLPELKVLVFDRPWNQDCAFPNGNYQRCADWESIRKIVRRSGMYIVKAEAEQVENIVNMSIRAFETDVTVGGKKGDCPPGFDSIEWHKQMAREGHLYQAMIENDLVGAAIVFPDETEKSVYIGRIFIDSVYHRKGYGILLMECIEKNFPWADAFDLDTPCWNERTNAFYKKSGYRIIKVEDGFVFYQKRKSEPNTVRDFT